MSRRQTAAPFRYEFEKNGAFGVFKTNGSVPIEYFMTSFKVDELPYLSFAKDVNTELNFDYLIQRDIDEDRAIAEISQYLAASEGVIQKEIVFLPPLLVAVVAVDHNNCLEDYYPNSSFAPDNDDVGDIFIREWPGVLRVTNYAVEQEQVRTFACANGDHQAAISVDDARIQLNLTRDNIKGARLVVIDGQHRLFALNALMAHDRGLIEGLTLPICLVYPPNSIVNNADEQPSVPEVLRNLFVDVNSTVERVSGHFLTLLSEQTLGSIICREFCKAVLDQKQCEGLGLIEWNTKNHKQSLEIAREHTLTSIGVINSAFEEIFKTKNGARLLAAILGIDKRAADFDFGTDEYEEVRSVPEYFPWRDFLSRHRERMVELVNETITPSLMQIFFGTSFFASYYEDFKNFFNKTEEEIRRDRRNDQNTFSNVKDHVLLNGILNKPAQAMHAQVRESLGQIIVDNIPDFSRKAIFQKAVIEAWSLLCSRFVANDISVLRAAHYIKQFIEQSFATKAGLFDDRHLYLQDTIFSGSRIKVTKSAKRQIVRLLLSNGSKVVAEDTRERDIISALAKEEVGSFIRQMRDDKRKIFEKSYRTNFSIAAVDRDRLHAAELDKPREMKELAGDSSKTTFDKLVDELISTNLTDSFDDLARTLNSKDFLYSKSEEFDDEL
ncbi:ParB N-terminal domain-containing protein [Pseudomonas sp. VEM90]